MDGHGLALLREHREREVTRHGMDEDGLALIRERRARQLADEVATIAGLPYRLPTGNDSTEPIPNVDPLWSAAPWAAGPIRMRQALVKLGPRGSPYARICAHVPASCASSSSSTTTSVKSSPALSWKQDVPTPSVLPTEDETTSPLLTLLNSPMLDSFVNELMTPDLKMLADEAAGQCQLTSQRQPLDMWHRDQRGWPQRPKPVEVDVPAQKPSASFRRSASLVDVRFAEPADAPTQPPRPCPAFRRSTSLADVRVAGLVRGDKGLERDAANAHGLPTEADSDVRAQLTSHLRPSRPLLSTRPVTESMLFHEKSTCAPR
jgi:hypothetical protein